MQICSNHDLETRYEYVRGMELEFRESPVTNDIEALASLIIFGERVLNEYVKIIEGSGARVGKDTLKKYDRVIQMADSTDLLSENAKQKDIEQLVFSLRVACMSASIQAGRIVKETNNLI